MPSRVSSAEFVGRAGELGVLDAALTRAADGSSGAVLVAGDAGIGKSRLIAEFERRATEGGALVLVGESVDLAGGELPYGPMVAALRPLVSAQGNGSAAALLPSARASLGRLWPALAEEGAPAVEPAEFGQGQLFEAIHGLLAQAATAQPVALVIEDLHWADRSTRDLLTFLIRNSRGQRVLFVASYRSDEVHRRHPLHPFVAELERGGSSERVDLAPFTREETIAQLTGILGETPEPWLAERLADRAEGNPFFTEELLAAADDGPMPESLRDALLMRVERLSPTARDVLALSAAAGRSVGHGLLAAAAALPPAELAAALREAVANRVLASAPNGTDYEFRHTLVREAVYADLLPGERVTLHTQLAGALEADPSLASAGTAVAELAHHWHAAGDADRGLPASLEAAAAAQSVHAHAETLLHLERALELWARVPEERRPAASELDVLRRAAAAATFSGDQRRAVVLERKVLDGTTDPIGRALAHSRLGRYLWMSGEEALPHYQAAVDLVPPEPPSRERAHVLAALAHVLVLGGQPAGAHDRAEEALEMARRADARDVEASALNTFGCTLSAVGEANAGIDAIRAARAIAEELGSVEEIGRSYINESQVLDASGRLGESVEVSESGFQRATELGSALQWGGFLLGDLADRLFRLGQWDAAIERARLVLERSRGDLNAASAYTVLGRIAAERGDFDAATEHIEQSARLSGRSGGPMWSGPNYAALGVRELWRGDVAAALDVLTHGLEEVGDFDFGVMSAETHALHVRAAVEKALRERALGHADEAAAAEAVARAGLERLAAAILPADTSSVASTDRAVAEAELIRLAPEPDAAPWLELAERWSSLEQPYRAAYAQWRAAEALIVAGDRGPEVERLLAAADAVARELGAEPMAAELASLARRAQIADLTPTEAASSLGLTPREHEVLILVAAGRTNREIGAELFMSEKTASVHVSRILQKLGVANRAEAAGVAHTLGVKPQ